MALPTPEKTWQFAHVAPAPSGTTTLDEQNIIYQMKEALKAFGTLPWVCAGSNDGVTAAMDGVDRINTPTKFTFTGTVGASWIVLEAPDGLQMLLYGANGGSFSLAFYTKFSRSAGFTGGTTTSIPTATDEDQTTAGNGHDLFNWSGFPTGVQVACHIMHSTDGEETRMFFCIQGYCDAWIGVGVAGQPGSLWNGRWYGHGPFTNANLATSQWTWNVGQNWIKAQTPGGSFGYLNALKDMSQQTNIYEAFTVPNEISGEVPLWPLGLYGNPTYITGLRGQAGYLKDWWLTVNSINAGDGFPGDASKQFMSFGSGIVVPWDGTTPVLG